MAENQQIEEYKTKVKRLLYQLVTSESPDTLQKNKVALEHYIDTFNNQNPSIKLFEITKQICFSNPNLFIEIWPWRFEEQEITSVLTSLNQQNRDSIDVLLSNIDRDVKFNSKNIDQILSLLPNLSLDDAKSVINHSTEIKSSQILVLYNKSKSKNKNLEDFFSLIDISQEKITRNIEIENETLARLFQNNKINNDRHLHLLLQLIDKQECNEQSWNALKNLVDTENIEIKLETYILLNEKFPYLEKTNSFRPIILDDTIKNDKEMVESICNSNCNYKTKQKMFKYIRWLQKENGIEIEKTVNSSNAQLCLIDQENFIDEKNGFLKYVAQGGANYIIKSNKQKCLNIICAIVEKLVHYLKDAQRGWWQNRFLKSKVISGIAPEFRNLVNDMTNYFLTIDKKPTPYLFHCEAESLLNLNYQDEKIIRGYENDFYYYYDSEVIQKLAKQFNSSYERLTTTKESNKEIPEANDIATSLLM